MEPWESEPDFKFFISSDLPCCIRRHPEFGCLLGYVGVPHSHPWYKLGEDALVTPVTMDESELTPLILTIDVHGGLTFIGFIHQLEGWDQYVEMVGFAEAWFFGFDCSHYMDRSPGLERKLRELGAPEQPFGDTIYRDMDYVTGECARLAAQLAIVERRGVR